MSAAARGLERFRREWTNKRLAKHVYDAFKVKCEGGVEWGGVRGGERCRGGIAACGWYAKKRWVSGVRGGMVVALTGCWWQYVGPACVRNFLFVQIR